MANEYEPLASPQDVIEVSELLENLAGRLHHIFASATPTTGGREHPEGLLSVREVGGRLGVGRTTVYALIGSGELRSLRVRGRRLVPESALRQFIRDAGS